MLPMDGRDGRDCDDSALKNFIHSVARDEACGALYSYFEVLIFPHHCK